MSQQHPGAFIDHSESSNTLGLLLTEYQSHILDAHLTERWSERRPEWMGECNSAASVSEYAELLIELETNILWSGVQESWRQRREYWISNCRSAQNIQELAVLLEELVNVSRTEALHAYWPQLLPDWKDRLSRVNK